MLMPHRVSPDAEGPGQHLWGRKCPRKENCLGNSTETTTFSLFFYWNMFLWREAAGREGGRRGRGRENEWGVFIYERRDQLCYKHTPQINQNSEPVSDLS